MSFLYCLFHILSISITMVHRIFSILSTICIWCRNLITDRRYEPRHEKTCLRGFRPGPTQTGLCSLRRQLEAGNFGFRKKRDCTFGVAKTKALISFTVCGYRKADLRLCFRICKRLVFSLRGSYINHIYRKPVSTKCDQQQTRSLNCKLGNG